MYKHLKFNYKLILTASLLLCPLPVQANTDVVVSNNGAGSRSEVNIKNEVNTTTSTSTNNSDVKTDIRIETNGEVKEYHSTGDDDVTVESSNGNNRVQVTNKTGRNSGSKITPTRTPTGTPVATLSATPSVTVTPKPQPQNLESYFENLRLKIFRFFGFIFGN